MVLFNRKLPALGLALALLFAASPAAAAFIDDYAFANWSLTQTPGADGFVVPSGAPTDTIVLTGSEANGTPAPPADDPSVTDFTITVATSGTISFDWDYQSLDAADWDRGAYLVNGGEFFLAQNDSATSNGTVTIAVTAGDVFGFRVGSRDQAFSPGILTIDNFSFVPEPSTAVLLLLGTIGLAVAGRRRTPGAGYAAVPTR
ncbi:MAG: PEP-CTERM sorting domain-containing protein [Myxococcales bacterium]|nr:PEP-CTERM sorting domain-containing protein [Myxococcales bacterium]